MNRPLSGGAAFLLCLFVGIIADQVALGILGGMVLAAIIGSRKAREDGAPQQNTERAD